MKPETSISGKEGRIMLSVGTKAPDFSLQDQNGKEHSLNDYRAAVSGSRFDDYRFFSLSNALAALIRTAEAFIESCSAISAEERS